MKKKNKILIIFVLVIILILAIYYFYPEKPLPKRVAISSIVVEKYKHRMDVFSGKVLLKSYSVALGRGVYGIHDGDWSNITPTGNFFIDSKFANSGYHRALTISYGNEVELHGNKNGFGFLGKFQRWVDWTRGCIALTDSEIDELYRAVPVGTPITIKD